MARIAVTGLWHQGVVLAASLASLGHDVHALAEDASAAAALSAGEPPLHEPGLSSLLRDGLESGRLRVTAAAREALARADLVFLSSDTPVDDDDRPRLESVFELARRIARGLSADVVLCVTAQVPVGTTQDLGRLVAAESGRRCDAVYVPEFLRLGTAINSFRDADRFVVGADDDGVAQRVADLFRPLGRPLVVTDVRTAEFAKHAANAFLATSVSFANELSDLASAVGAEYRAAAAILRLDRRIGPDAFLMSGLGFAGGTLGREVRALQAFGSQHDVATPLLDAVVAVNFARPRRVLWLLEQELNRLQGAVIAIFGLTYKAGTNTLRRSVSLEIARALAERGATVRAFDPLADLRKASELPPVQQRDDAYSAADGADAVLLVTPWSGHEDLDFARLRRVMRGNLLIDGPGSVGADASGLKVVRV